MYINNLFICEALLFGVASFKKLYKLSEKRGFCNYSSCAWWTKKENHAPSTDWRHLDRPSHFNIFTLNCISSYLVNWYQTCLRIKQCCFADAPERPPEPEAGRCQSVSFWTTDAVVHLKFLLQNPTYQLISLQFSPANISLMKPSKHCSAISEYLVFHVHCKRRGIHVSNYSIATPFTFNLGCLFFSKISIFTANLNCCGFYS